MLITLHWALTMEVQIRSKVHNITRQTQFVNNRAMHLQLCLFDASLQIQHDDNNLMDKSVIAGSRTFVFVASRILADYFIHSVNTGYAADR